MRARKKKNLAARTGRVAEFAIGEPRRFKGRWSELTGGRPLHIEIGCGKGRFAVGTALANPDVFLVAIEVEPNVLVMAMEEAARAGVENLRFISMNAEALDSCFAKGEVSRIYLNFSDPWPHNKNRRLTYETFLASYRRVLAEDGELRFKTDNRDLFDWSCGELERCGWRLGTVSHDVHGAEPVDAGIATEYEERFMALGTPINYLDAEPPEGELDEQVELADCTAADCAELARLALRVWRTRFTPVYGRVRTAEMIENGRSERSFEKLFADGYRCELLRVAGEDAGMLVTRHEGDVLRVEELSVERRFRGRGFGRMLAGAAERRAAEFGCVRLEAHCPAEDTEGMRAAAALGFGERGELLVRELPRTRWRYLLIDADGTLFDFDRAERRAIEQTLASCGLPSDDATCALYSRLNAAEWKRLERGEVTSEELRRNRFLRLGEALGVEVDPDLLNSTYMQKLSAGADLLDGAYEAVERLSRECTVAVVTNGLPPVQRARMESSGLGRLVHRLYISGEVGYSKPAPEFFDAVCRDMGIDDRSQAIVVGDSLTSDIAGAKNSGIASCLFDPHGVHPTGVADFTVRSYGELERLIEL